MATLEMNVRQVNADFQSIKKTVNDAVRQYGNEDVITEGTKTSEYSDKITEAIEVIGQVRFIDGTLDGFDHGREEGRTEEYNNFWDAYQKNGEPMNCSFMFAGHAWNETNFRPKYDIVPNKSARYMFAVTNNLQIDIEAKLNELGVKLDTSNVTETDGFSYFCQYAGPTVLPVINTTGTSALRNVFSNSPTLVTVRKFIFKSDGTQEILKMLDGCTKLEHFIVEGTIGQYGFDVKWSPLDKESLTSIVNALSTTTSGLTVTLSLNAVNKAFETSDGANDGSTSAEWLALVATRENWNIALATV